MFDIITAGDRFLDFLELWKCTFMRDSNLEVVSLRGIPRDFWVSLSSLPCQEVQSTLKYIVSLVLKRR